MDRIITLLNHMTSAVITSSMVEQYEEIILQKMEKLNYNNITCYSVAAIALFLDTLKKDERKEILNVLHLQTKKYE